MNCITDIVPVIYKRYVYYFVINAYISGWSCRNMSHSNQNHVSTDNWMLLSHLVVLN